MRIALTKSFGFEAAHFLPTFPEGHKCRRVMHGHSFKVDVVVEGEVDPKLGYLIDFGEIKAAIKPIEEALDHHLLNEIEGLENPTVELIAKWIWDRLKPELDMLSIVRVYETGSNSGEYRGE
ncbi:MAG: 6-carboxytetrahydropterin synthase QueD [Planctomycetota bacterium]